MFDARVARVRAAVGSVIFLVVAPGTVVGLVPWILTNWHAQLHERWWLPLAAVGGLILAASVAVLLQAFARFVFEGMGTPAPVAPPERLVVGGMYRYVRNPMYVAVVAAILGQALVLAQPILVAYAGGAWLTVATFVHWYEQPRLARKFGSDYTAYCAAVRAWLPRLRPWTPFDQNTRSASG